MIHNMPRGRRNFPQSARTSLRRWRTWARELSEIPELEIVEIPEAPICCGSAGIYNLVQPDAANELGDRKAELIASLDADVVVTGNPGCILQLQASLERAGKKIPVLHTIQLLDASIRGQLPSALRK